MGAELQLKERTLAIHGRELFGAEVRALDIRAGGALVVGALAAKGESRIEGTHHLERGYENLVAKLRGLGAEVGRAEPRLEEAAD